MEPNDCNLLDVHFLSAVLLSCYILPLHSMANRVNCMTENTHMKKSVWLSPHFSHIVRQHGCSAEQAGEGSPLQEEGSATREGGAGQPRQMVNT